MKGFSRIAVLLLLILVLLGLTVTPTAAQGPNLPPSGIAYAFRGSSAGTAFVSFTLDSFGKESVISTMDVYPGADFIYNDFAMVYALTKDNVLLGISTIGGKTVVMGKAVPTQGEVWSGMTWDPTTNTLYAITSVSESTMGSARTGAALYTINPYTGDATRIATISDRGVMVDIAAHPFTGDLYAINATADTLVLLDKVSGATKTVGALKFNAATYGQALDFNDETGVLYFTALNAQAPFDGQLRMVDIRTGATTLITSYGAKNYRDGLAIAIPTPPSK